MLHEQHVFPSQPLSLKLSATNFLMVALSWAIPPWACHFHNSNIALTDENFDIIYCLLSLLFMYQFDRDSSSEGILLLIFSYKTNQPVLCIHCVQAMLCTSTDVLWNVIHCLRKWKVHVESESVSVERKSVWKVCMLVESECVCVWLMWMWVQNKCTCRKWKCVCVDSESVESKCVWV